MPPVLRIILQQWFEVRPECIENRGLGARIGVQAIRLHASDGSEANVVVARFAILSPQDQQDLINFLRSL